MPRWGHLHPRDARRPVGARLGPPPGRCLSPYTSTNPEGYFCPTEAPQFRVLSTHPEFKSLSQGVPKKCSASRGCSCRQPCRFSRDAGPDQMGGAAARARSNNPPNRRICHGVATESGPSRHPRPVADPTAEHPVAVHGWAGVLTHHAVGHRPSCDADAMRPSAPEVLLRMLRRLGW